MVDPKLLEREDVLYHMGLGLVSFQPYPDDEYEFLIRVRDMNEEGCLVSVSHCVWATPEDRARYWNVLEKKRRLQI